MKFKLEMRLVSYGFLWHCGEIQGNLPSNVDPKMNKQYKKACQKNKFNIALNLANIFDKYNFVQNINLTKLYDMYDIYD